MKLPKIVLRISLTLTLLIIASYGAYSLYTGNPTSTSEINIIHQVQAGGLYKSYDALLQSVDYKDNCQSIKVASDGYYPTGEWVGGQLGEVVGIHCITSKKIMQANADQFSNWLINLIEKKNPFLRIEKKSRSQMHELGADSYIDQGILVSYKEIPLLNTRWNVWVQDNGYKILISTDIDINMSFAPTPKLPLGEIYTKWGNTKLRVPRGCFGSNEIINNYKGGNLVIMRAMKKIDYYGYGLAWFLHSQGIGAYFDTTNGDLVHLDYNCGT